MEKQGKVSFVAAVLMSINIIVGVGIYFGPQIMAKEAGNVSFLGWVVGGILLFPLIWSVALAARMFPGEGGFYNYGLSGLNATVGFLTSWAYYLGFLAVASTIAMALKGVIVDSFNATFLNQYPWMFSFVVVVILSLLNLLSIEVISKIQSTATLLKLVPLFIVIAIFSFYWDPSFTVAPGNFWNVGYTLPIAIFGFWGFESTTNIGHLLVGGTKMVFKVALTAFFISTLLYTLFHFGILHMMGAVNLANLGVPAFTQFLGIQSQGLLTAIKWGLIVVFILNYLNSIYGIMLFNSSNLATLAERKLIFYSEKISETNKNGRPLYAIALQGLMIFLLLSCVPSTEILAAIANLGLVTVNALVLASIFNTQRKQEKYLGLIGTLFGFASCAVVTYFSWMSIADTQMARLLYSIPFFVALFTGLVMFKLQQTEKPKIS